MLASKIVKGTAVNTYATGEWIAEEKFDGHRVVVAVQRGLVAAWSRPRAGERRGNVRDLPAHIASALATFPAGVYDGELIIPGGKSWDVGALETNGTHELMLFDVIVYGQQELDRVSQLGRREILEAAFASVSKSKRGKVKLSPQFPPSQAALDAIWARKGEGIILKHLDGRYEPNCRASSWIKVKRLETAEFTVTGFLPGKNSPCGIVAMRDDQGIETTVKALNNADVRRFEQNPQAFIGRRAWLEFQERHPATNVPRHPMFDRFVDE